MSWLCAAPTVLISLANAPASVRGEVPAGVHVVTAGAPPTAATIERLAHFKAPHGVTFVDELPKTATGKIQKFVLRKGAPNRRFVCSSGCHDTRNCRQTFR